METNNNDFARRAMERLHSDPNIVVEVLPNREAWLIRRENFLTASDISVLCGRSSYKGIYRLAHEKLGLLRDDAPEETEWQRAGHYLEPAIAQWYADDEGNPVYDPGPFTLIWNRKYPGIAATLDRITQEAKLGWGVLELKNRGLTTNDDWKAGIPESVRMQMQVQMLVTGFGWGDAAALVGGNQFYVGREMANKRFQLAAVRRAAQFWRDLREGILPQPGDHPDDAETFNRLYPDDSGDLVMLPAEFREVWERLNEISYEKKALDAEEEALKNRVKGALGPHTYGIGHGYSFSLKTQCSKGKVTIAAVDDLERVATVLKKHGIPCKISTDTKYRVLRHKEIKS